MKLSAEQLRQFEQQGYIFIPNCFADEEVALMRSEGEAILRAERKEVWRETNGAPRTAFACDKYNPVCEMVRSDARLVDPVDLNWWT